MKGPQENGARIWLGASGHEVFGGFSGFQGSAVFGFSICLGL